MSKYIERFTMTVSTGNWEKLMEIEKNSLFVKTI